jgi:AcrR family transcriptional regulator
MNLSSSSQKRPYRMTARAEAAAATGERVLAAAWCRFSTRPYEEVLLRDVASEAQVSAQTLHDRFGSKDELFIASYAWFGQRELSDRPPSPTTNAAEAVTLLFDRYEAHGAAVLRMLSQEERIPAVRKMTDAGRSYHRIWVEGTFAPLLRGLRGDARELRLTTITTATDLLNWKLLRQDMRLARARAERVMVEMIQVSA